MIKTFSPSTYKDIKEKSEKLIYLCLWAWLNIEWREMFFWAAKKFGFKYLGERVVITPDGSEIKVPAWWDGYTMHFRLSLEPTFYTDWYHIMEIPEKYKEKMPSEIDKLQPKGLLIEKEFLEKFALKMTTFVTALHKLRNKNLIDFDVAKSDKGRIARYLKFKEPLIKMEEANLRRHKLKEQAKFVKEKGYSEAMEKPPRYTLNGTIIRLPLCGTKITYISDGIKVRFPLTKLVQIPLIVLTQRNLSIAERLIGIELYRMKKEEKLNMQRRGNRSYMYFGKKKIKMEDLAKKIEFGKPTVIKTLKKLWYWYFNNLKINSCIVFYNSFAK